MAQDNEKTPPTGGNTPKKAATPAKAAGNTAKAPAKAAGNTAKAPAKAGGNTAKPATGTSAKDRSRQQSRPVSGKAATGKGGNAPKPGGGKGGNAPRSGKAVATKPPSNRGVLIAWVSVGVVIVIIAVLVIINATSSTTAAAGTPVTPVPASILSAVTSIPTSVYDAVGTGGSASTPPTVLSGQPPLTINGQSPAILYVGAEYCPFCAAERWAVVTALSRFGTWSGLQVTASSGSDEFPLTQTFSFRTASITSPYISFHAVEEYTNEPASGGGYKPLQHLTAAESANVEKYDSPTYLPNDTQAGSISYPFININNQALISSSSYSPGLLTNQSHQEIASNLTDPSNPATQAILGTSNYISAVICASTKQQPSDVCTSSGVQAAAKALKLS
jgi:hypothetical protein